MRLLEEILNYNQHFVNNREYEPYKTDKIPDKRLVVISCMDTRLTELLPRAMNLHNGDAKIIKDAGAIVAHPFGSVMRSVLVAIYELGAEEVCVIGHHGCGMESIEPKNTIAKMVSRGISMNTIETIGHCGIDLDSWLHGFDDVFDSVRKSIEVIRTHPLMLPNIPVHGLVIDPDTGRLDLVVDGYEVLV